MFREGPKGFKGGMSAGKYSIVTGASPATTIRDLVELTTERALTREGERRRALQAQRSTQARCAWFTEWHGELIGD
jgi:hypothetical protein